MGDDLLFQSASVVPMLSSGWQAMQDPESAELDPEENTFRCDGKFVPNAKIQGSWQVVAEVPEVGAFNPEKKQQARRAPFSTITLGADAKTSDPAWAWSGDKLMDLTNYQVLRMEPKTLADTDYLFVEAGGFSTRDKPGWKPTWYVMERR